MAERVARVEPRLASRLVVRHHPLTPPRLGPASGPPAILVPVLFAPFIAATPVPTTTQPLFFAQNDRKQRQFSQGG